MKQSCELRVLPPPPSPEGEGVHPRPLRIHRSAPALFTDLYRLPVFLPGRHPGLLTEFYRILSILTGYRLFARARAAMLGERSNLPVHHLVHVFGRRDVAGGFGEGAQGGFAGDFGAKACRQAEQPGRGHGVELALFQLLFDPLHQGGEIAHPLVLRPEEFLNQPLGLGGAQVLDFELVLASPLDQGRFGDAEFDGNAVEAPSLGAEEFETFDGFLIGHVILSGCTRNGGSMSPLKKIQANRLINGYQI